MTNYSINVKRIVNNTMPQVSVLMPVYNGQAYIGKAIESILNQTFKDFELLILDDGSTDNTVTVVKRFMESDSRILLYECNRQGLSSILNYGINIARAELIARMDADDIAKPTRLCKQTAEMNCHTDHAVIGGSIERFSQENGPRYRIEFPCSSFAVRRLMEYRCVVAHPTVMFRRSIVLSLGGYRTIFKRAQDYDLWLRLLDAGYSISNIKEVLIEHRKHTGSASNEHGRDQFLSADIARLSHRTRKLGLQDPLDGFKSIQPQVYNAFQEFLPIDAAVEKLFLSNTNLGTYSIGQLNNLLYDFKKLKVRKHCGQSTTKFLFSLGITYFRMGSYARCLRVFSLALFKDIFVLVRFINRLTINRLLLFWDRFHCVSF